MPPLPEFLGHRPAVRAIAGSEEAAPAAALETASRTVEDGGTGPYQALMVSEKSLATHTVFRPRDLSAFGEKSKLPIIAWGNGACANSPWEHVNFLSEVASHGFLVVAIGPMPEQGQRRSAGVFEPKNLISLLARHSLPTEYGCEWTISAVAIGEVEELLEAVLGDWLDFLFIPTPKPFVIYADHDEFTTFYANTKSNLTEVVQPLSEKGFKFVTGFERVL